VGAWSSGGTCLVIDSAEHVARVRRRLASPGLAANRQRETLLESDASEALQHFMVEGHPDPLLFDGTVGCLVRDQVDSAAMLWVFDGMSAILWAEGNIGAAGQLEQLWGSLRQTVRFTLLCGYSSPCLGHDGRKFLRAVHDRVIPQPR
jgi:hypothetical protein